MPPYRVSKTGITLRVRLTPNAAHDRIEGEEVRDDGQTVLRVRVRAVPDKGKANKALVALLAKTLKQPKSGFKIISGQTARLKSIAITGEPAPILAALDSLAKIPETKK
jgi:uncharacterized protein